jgi:hypothetical protein
MKKMINFKIEISLYDLSHRLFTLDFEEEKNFVIWYILDELFPGIKYKNFPKEEIEERMCDDHIYNKIEIKFKSKV